MRRVLIVVLAACLAALPTGCGGGSKKPLDEALGYLPKDSPFVVAIDTNVGGDQYEALGRLVKRFPFGAQAGQSLKHQFERGGRIDFDRDVKPLLGDPFVVGSASARSFIGGAAGRTFVGAIKAKDGGKLKDLAKRADARTQGERNGGTIYRDDRGGYFAIKGDVLVVAGSRAVLEDALARRGHGGRLDQKTFDDHLEGVPSKALVRGYGDVRRLLRASRRARQALRVPWVSALRSIGFSARAERDGVRVDFDVKSDKASLSADQLPLATGDRAPAIVRRPGEIAIGIRDPGQLVDFALGAARAARPGFAAERRQLEQAVGIDLKRDVTDQLTGGASLDVTAAGQFGVRADVRDPAAFKRTLRKLADALPRFARSTGAGTLGVAKPKAGKDFYAIARPNGQSVVFGVVGRALVVANSPTRAGQLAAERPRRLPGAKGSLVLEADAEKLANELLKRFAPQAGAAGALFTSPLGELTGSVSSSTDGLRGWIKLGID